ncbi:MAG TPA: site-specific integrase [Burkholderiaceae bacterium]|nr:site-specific integrase [Burkholderiaceae bacterium]
MALENKGRSLRDIGPHQRRSQLARRRQLEAVAALLRVELRALHDVLDQLGEHERLAAQLDARRLELGKLEEIGNAPKLFGFWRCLVQTLYYTGMRRAQLLGLRWGDIDFEAKTIRLRAATSKTWREWRIPLSEALEPYILELRDRTIRVRSPLEPNGQVFCLPIFLPRWFKRSELSNWRLSAFFTRLSHAVSQELSASDIRVGAHRYRHTAATLLMRRTGGNINVVQSILGHADAKSTLVYVGADLSDRLACRFPASPIPFKPPRCGTCWHLCSTASR